MTRRQKRVRNRADGGHHGQAEAMLRRAEQTALDNQQLAGQLNQMIGVLLGMQVGGNQNLPLPQNGAPPHPQQPRRQSIPLEQAPTPLPPREDEPRHPQHRVRRGDRDGAPRDGRGQAGRQGRDPDGLVPVLENLGRIVQQNTIERDKTPFAQALSTMPNLTGREGRSEMEIFFRKLEAVTEGWSDSRRATLLSTCVKDNAKVIYEGMSPEQQMSYDSLKYSLLEGNASTAATRHAAQLQLLGGIRPRRGETVVEYGQRVLQQVKNASYPGTPQESIEDTAETHFLKFLDDASIRHTLLIQRCVTNYHDIINQASILYDSTTTPTVFRRSHMPDGLRECYHCREIGHEARYCPNMQRVGGFSGRDAGYRRPEPTQRPQPGYRPMQQRGYPMSGANRQPMGQANRPPQGPPNRFQPPPGVNAFAGDEPQSSTSSQNPDVSKIQQAAGNVTRNFTSCSTVIGSAIGRPAVQSSEVLSVPRQGLVGNPSKPPSEREINASPPCGPSIVTTVSIHEVNVESLLDPGANISMITMRCLGTIAKTNELDLVKMDIRSPSCGECRAANSATIPMFGAVCLPVIKSGRTTLVEFQIPDCPLPYPIILGTNSLPLLGYQFIESATGRDLLTAHQSSSPCEAKRPLKEEIGVRVHRVAPHPSSPKRVCVQRASEPKRVCAERASEPTRVSPPQSRASSEIVGRLWHRGRDGPVAKQRPRHSRAGRSRVKPWHNRHRSIDNGLHSASTHRPR